MAVNFLSAVLIVADDAPRLAAWYRDVLGLPLESEQHGGGGEAEHFGCFVRGVHLAVHPTANYSFAPETGRGAIRLAFHVDDLAAFEAGLAEQDVDWVFHAVDLGWSTMLALRDLEGNMIEVLEMTPTGDDRPASDG